MSVRGVLLFGHGSRDPQWREPMDQVARRIAEQSPGIPVACAFLEMQAPDFGQAVTELVGAGATSITVLPMFLGIGKHVREDLPALVAQVRERHPGLTLHLLPSVGEQPEVLQGLADRVLTSSP